MPGHTVACISGEESELGEPKTFIIGTVPAFPSGEMHLIPSMDVHCILEMIIWNGQCFTWKICRNGIEPWIICQETHSQIKQRTQFSASLARYKHLTKFWCIKCKLLWQLLGNAQKEKKTGICPGPRLIFSPDGWNVDVMLEYEQPCWARTGMLGLRMAEQQVQGA